MNSLETLSDASFVLVQLCIWYVGVVVSNTRQLVKFVMTFLGPEYHISYISWFSRKNDVQCVSVYIWAQSLLLQRSDLGHHTHGSPHYNCYQHTIWYSVCKNRKNSYKNDVRNSVSVC
jgi:hypothetical protein